MKQRFSSLDVKVCAIYTPQSTRLANREQVIAHELSAKLTSLRVTNVYDLSSVCIILLAVNMPNRR
jgi:hypothetical protein